MARLLMIALSGLSGIVAAAEPVADGVKPLTEPVSTGNILQMLLGLAVVIALMLALAWAMRRFTGFQSGASGSLRILGGLSLGHRERVVLIQAGETQLLLGVAPGRVQTLHVLEEHLEQGRSEAARPSFGDSLKAAIKGQTS